LPPSFPLPLLPSPSLPLPPLPTPPPTDIHIRSTRSGNGLTIRRHHVHDGWQNTDYGWSRRERW
jgi:hypothetical protein